jgi:hypothetical protein
VPIPRTAPCVSGSDPPGVEIENGVPTHWVKRARSSTAGAVRAVVAGSRTVIRGGRFARHPWPRVVEEHRVGAGRGPLLHTAPARIGSSSHARRADALPPPGSHPSARHATWPASGGDLCCPVRTSHLVRRPRSHLQAVAPARRSLLGGPRAASACRAVAPGSCACAEGVGFEPTVRRTYNGFRDRPIRPLSHPSGGRAYWAPGRRLAKKARNSAPHSRSSTYGTTSSSWLRRGSAHRL